MNNNIALKFKRDLERPNFYTKIQINMILKLLNLLSSINLSAPDLVNLSFKAKFLR